MTESLPAPFVLGPDALPEAETVAVLDGALVATADVAPLEVSGPGAVACIQGLLTNDVEKPGDGSYGYGAILTPKGMIVTDLWSARSAGGVSLRVPRQRLDAVQEVLQRSLPPRLARVTDLSADHVLQKVTGPEALEVAGRAGLAVPEEGRIASAVIGGMMAVVARPEHAPFALEIFTSGANALQLRDRLIEAGAQPGSAASLAFARVLAGWPGLDAEIDGRTLPQEVRLDEHGGVSYTKGCYVGQETVARLHFRGHTNRALRGLVWEDEPDPDDAVVSQEDKPRGRVSSMVWVPSLDRWLGLGMLRREVDFDEPVIAAGHLARALPLPFPLSA